MAGESETQVVKKFDFNPRGERLPLRLLLLPLGQFRILSDGITLKYLAS